MAAGQLHGRVIKLNLGAALEVVDAGAVGRKVANGGELDGSLVLVPLLSLGPGRRVVLFCALRLLGHLLSALDHGLLLDGRGVVHGVSVLLRGVGVEAVTDGRALAGNRREARAAGHGRGHALGGVGHLDGAVLALALAARHLEGGWILVFMVATPESPLTT